MTAISRLLRKRFSFVVRRSLTTLSTGPEPIDLSATGRSLATCPKDASRTKRPCSSPVTSPPRRATELVIPFPQPLCTMTELRQVTVTLAWFSPINWNHRQYRRAKLTVDGPPEVPSKTRVYRGPDYHLLQRGTVHQRRFETTNAFPPRAAHLHTPMRRPSRGPQRHRPLRNCRIRRARRQPQIDVYELIANRVRLQTRIQ